MTTLRPLLLLARRCRTGQSTLSMQSVWSSTIAGDLFRRSTPTTKALCLPTSASARHFSDDNNNNNNNISDNSKKLESSIASLKIRRPAVGGGGDGSGGPQQQRQRQPYQRGGRGDGGGGRNHRTSTSTRTIEPPLPDDPFLRTHMIDLFPGNYEEDASTTAGGSDSKSDDWNDDEEEREYLEVEATMAQLHKESLEYDEKKKRWMENSKPIVRVPVIDHVGRSYGRGARKAAQARVWITPGFGNVTVNRKDLVEYFPRFSDRELLLAPMVVTGTCGKFDLQCLVKGGGLTGQAGAVRLGVARALQHWNPAYRPVMKKMGYLTRDARRVERKKTGLVKARKAPQWNRR